MSWSWRTLPDERVEVDMGQGYTIPVLEDHPGVQAAAERTLEWLPLAIAKGEKYDVPPSWILGIILSESGGKPDAENECCVGLMAIYASVHGKSREEMKDPDKNVDYGTSLLASSRQKGLELPEAASVHVAGGGTTGTPHPSSKSVWGMREHTWPAGSAGDGTVGYIDRVVRANNMFVEELGAAVDRGPSQPSEPAPVSQAGMGGGKKAGLLAAGAALGWGAIRLLPRL